jgi:hypothetical protein
MVVPIVMAIKGSTAAVMPGTCEADLRRTTDDTCRLQLA